MQVHVNQYSEGNNLYYNANVLSPLPQHIYNKTWLITLLDRSIALIESSLGIGVVGNAGVGLDILSDFAMELGRKFFTDGDFATEFGREFFTDGILFSVQKQQILHQ